MDMPINICKQLLVAEADIIIKRALKHMHFILRFLEPTHMSTNVLTHVQLSVHYDLYDASFSLKIVYMH